MKHSLFFATSFLGLFSLIATSCLHSSAKKTVVFEEDTVSVIKNPCMGWGLYDDANDEVQNADAYWKQQDEAARKYGSFFYVRWRWSEMEPEEGKYAWLYDENYKKLIQGALDRGLKLCFRIYNNSQDNVSQSTPDYVRKAGADGYMIDGENGKMWNPYPDDPIFQAKLNTFIEAFAKEYDNPDIVDFIDGYTIGWWGECHNIRLKSKEEDALQKVLDQITTIYSSHFKLVLLTLPFGSQVGFEAEHRIAIQSKGYSMRRDGLGSMWFSDSEREIVQQMYGKALFVGESCWWKSCSDSVRPWASDTRYKLESWRDVYELTYQHAMEGHFNTLDLREIPETTGWTTRGLDLVKGFCSKGGYRIHPTSITYASRVSQNDSLQIQHAWVNTGNGYLPNNVKNWGYKYKPVFALLDASGKIVKTFVDPQAEPSAWLTAQVHAYDFKVALKDVPAGHYRLCVAIGDKNKAWSPGIRLAIREAVEENGWYEVGELKID